MKLNLNKVSLKNLIAVTITFFTTVLLPIFSFLGISGLLSRNGMGFEVYLEKWRFIIIPLIIVGIIITVITILTMLIETYTINWLVYSIIPEVIYIIQIIMFSTVLTINFGIEGYGLTINLSSLFMIIILVPGVIIVRNIFYFFVKREEYRHKSVILKALSEMGSVSNKTKIKKFISNKLDISSSIKMYVLKNFSMIFSDLISEKKPLIKKSDRFFITKRGSSVLDYYNKIFGIRKEDFKRDNKEFETWKKRDLKKLKSWRSK